MTDAFTSTPLADVEAHEEGDQWTLVFVRDLRHPPAAVWAALTDPARVREWAPFTSDRDLGAAGEATLTMIDGDVAQELLATVRLAEPPSLLEYTWGTDLLRWELEPTGTGTRLTLRHTLADREWVPKVAAGWHICLVVAERLLDGAPIGPVRGAAALDHGWDQLNEEYGEKLGIPVTASRESDDDPR
jgi:uncharacterized protein YndB with AHSA1/START domain